jgi:hypothetical protein
MSRIGRPSGSFGEVGQALLKAASHGPGTARELAERVCVGYSAARYTASRLVSAGVLERTAERPARLALPGTLAAEARPPCSAWDMAPVYGFSDI